MDQRRQRHLKHQIHQRCLMYKITSIASAHTTLRNTVTITIIDLIERGEKCLVKDRFWCLESDSHVDNEKQTLIGWRSPQLVFVEPNIPHVVHQLYGVMIARGSNLIFDRFIQLYQLRGPMLYLTSSEICTLGCEHESHFLPRQSVLAEKLADWTHFEWIFKMLWLPCNRPWAIAVTLGARWRKLASSRIMRRRALERIALIKQELMAAAWHPRRMVNWCMDTDEQEELRALWGAQ